MATTRHATAHWSGDLKTGGGTISTPQSGLMAETAYGFNTRFGDKKGTNPEELIAAAHAACFTMALSNALAQAGHAPDAVRSAEHTSELQSLMRNSYAVFCMKKKKKHRQMKP